MVVSSIRRSSVVRIILTRPRSSPLRSPADHESELRTVSGAASASNLDRDHRGGTRQAVDRRELAEMTTGPDHGIDHLTSCCGKWPNASTTKNTSRSSRADRGYAAPRQRAASGSASSPANSAWERLCNNRMPRRLWPVARNTAPPVAFAAYRSAPHRRARASRRSSIECVVLLKPSATPFQRRSRRGCRRSGVECRRRPAGGRSRPAHRVKSTTAVFPPLTRTSMRSPPLADSGRQAVPQRPPRARLGATRSAAQSVPRAFRMASSGTESGWST